MVGVLDEREKKGSSYTFSGAKIVGSRSIGEASPLSTLVDESRFVLGLAK